MRNHRLPVVCVVVISLAGLLAGCPEQDKSALRGQGPSAKAPEAPATRSDKDKAMSFESDLAFLKKHTDVVLLTDPAGKAQVAVAPKYQGRVMTSTAGGPAGLSFGWINRDLIASGKTLPHFNPLGGEDRFWLGPEGGPFSIFFAKGKEQNLDNWYTPAAIDTEPFEKAEASATRATFKRTMKLANASGTQFDVNVARTVRLLDPAEAFGALGVAQAGDVSLVAYEADNRIANAGAAPWKKETGLLSVWILGMFNPSPATTIVIPFKPGPEAQLGPVVNDTYFGKVPADRLKVDTGAHVIYFSGDGEHRSKIGIPPKRALPNLGSYDAANKVLTIVQVGLPADVEKQAYVNSMWGKQDDPFSGDVINSYNDGPPAPGKAPMGPFYELESSSPAAALAPGQSLSHVHRTMHLQGPEASLDAIAKKVLGVGLEQIKGGLK